jgi:hypothetical protein
VLRISSREGASSSPGGEQRVIATSEGYASKAGAQNGIESVQSNAAGADIVDLTVNSFHRTSGHPRQRHLPPARDRGCPSYEGLLQQARCG